jgi:hypothetical protein
MKKVLDEELQELKSLRETYLEIITTLGELHLSKKILENNLKELSLLVETQENRFTEFQEKERVLYEKLQQKYGTGDIDFDTGEITE